MIVFTNENEQIQIYAITKVLQRIKEKVLQRIKEKGLVLSKEKSLLDTIVEYLGLKN